MINPPGGKCTNCLLENSGNKHSKNDADFFCLFKANRVLLY